MAESRRPQLDANVITREGQPKPAGMPLRAEYTVAVTVSVDPGRSKRQLFAAPVSLRAE